MHQLLTYLPHPQISDLTTWKVIDDSYDTDHLLICIFYAHHLTRAPICPRFNFEKEDWNSFRWILDSDISGDDIYTKVDSMQHSISNSARPPFQRLFQLPKSIEFHDGNQIVAKHLMSEIGDTVILASSPIR